jgi:parallel beta-helix repeat protein
MTGEHIRGIPRTYEKEITLADTPYTLSVGFNCMKVDTTGGNVRVNLPNVNYPIDVIKTSSDSYIVTVWVGGVQTATVAGELSKITIENAEVTADEPWYPYDAIVGIAGVSGDGGEVLAKDRFGRVIARGIAGTDDSTVIQAAITFSDHRVVLKKNTYYINPGITIYGKSHFCLDLGGSTLIRTAGYAGQISGTLTVAIITAHDCEYTDIFNGILDCNNMYGSTGIYFSGKAHTVPVQKNHNNAAYNLEVKNAHTYSNSETRIGYGIFAYDPVNILIEDNTCHNNNVGIFLRGSYELYGLPDPGALHNKIIDNLTYNNRAQHSLYAGIGIYVYGLPCTEISRNHVSENRLGMYVGEGDSTDYGYVINSNIVTDNENQGIHAADLAVVTKFSFISKNTCALNGHSGMIIGRNSIISGNVCYNNGQIGVPYDMLDAGIEVYFSLTPAFKSIIIGNICFDDQIIHTQKYGYLDGSQVSPGNTLIGNDFTQCLVPMSIRGSSVVGHSENTITTNVTAVNNSVYNVIGSALTTIILPSTTFPGSKIKIIGTGSCGWKIAQNVHDQIIVNGLPTSAGIAGYVASTSNYDTIELLCAKHRYYSMMYHSPLTRVTSNANGGTVDWTDIANIGGGSLTGPTSTAAVATSAANATTYYAKLTNFNFVIPAGATIDGVVVTTWGRASHNEINNYGVDSEVKLILADGSISVNNKASAVNWNVAESNYYGIKSYGNCYDLWGETFT